MKVNMKSSILIISVVASLSGFSAPEVPAWRTNLRPDHPRMFFNRETWPTVKATAEGSAKADFDKLIARVEKYPSDPVCSGYGPVPTNDYVTADGKHVSVYHTSIPPIKEFGVEAAECAFAWRVTGKPDYLAKARKMLQVSVAAYTEAYKNHRAVNWYSTSRIHALAAYDWIYEALTADERKGIIVPFVRHVLLAQDPKYLVVRRNGGSGRRDGCYGVSSLMWYAGLAAAGDGYCDNEAEKLLLDGYREFTSVCEYRNTGAADDGGLSSACLGYSVWAYPWVQFNFFHTFLSAFGENIAGKYPWLGLHANWIWWMWIPDADNPANPFEFGFGDAYHTTSRLGTSLLYQHLTQYMRFYADSDPSTARLAATLRDMSCNHDLSATWPIYPFLFSATDSVKPYSIETLRNHPVKARHFESLGEIVMRSGWKPDSTYAMMIAGATHRMHKHHDETSFVIFKHDFLALDSGSRANQDDLNLKYYYAQTVAHNCVLIHKPNEPLPGYWGPGSDEPAAKSNYGGQYPVSSKVVAFDTNGRYSYVAADATKCYGDKCKEAVRQFIHVQPDVFVVYDRVESAEAGFAKEWLLHASNEPVIDGSVARMDSRKGRLFSQTVFPVDAKIAKVGGPGKEFWSNGKNWEFNPAFVRNSMRSCTRENRGPYWGSWRIEVSPNQPSKRDGFLHVLTACDTNTTAGVVASRITDADHDGVSLSLQNGDRFVVLFNRADEIGGFVKFNDEPFLPLRKDILKQTGVGINGD